MTELAVYGIGMYTAQYMFTKQYVNYTLYHDLRLKINDKYGNK